MCLGAQPVEPRCLARVVVGQGRGRGPIASGSSTVAGHDADGIGGRATPRGCLPDLLGLYHGVVSPQPPPPPSPREPRQGARPSSSGWPRWSIWILLAIVG